MATPDPSSASLNPSTPLSATNTLGEVIVPGPRPWIRYFARSVDVILSLLVTFLLVWFVMDAVIGPDYALTYPPTLKNRTVQIFILLFWLLTEPLLLSTWGSTPGKWLFNIRLRTQTGEKLTFSQALKRMLSVWFFGWGLCVPIISLVTLIVSYFDLMKAGKTRWDRNGGFAVTHIYIDMMRRFLIALFLVAYVILAVMNGMYEAQMASKMQTTTTTTTTTETTTTKPTPDTAAPAASDQTTSE